MARLTEYSEVAAHILNGQHDKADFTYLSDVWRDASLEDAYSVQRIYVRKLLAERQTSIAGYKVGITSPDIQKLVGLSEPIAGVLFEDQLYSSPKRLKRSDFNRLGLEFEVALTAKNDLDGRIDYRDSRAILEHVDSMSVAFEILDDRSIDYGRKDASSAVADNIFTRGAVVAPERIAVDPYLLESAAAWVEVNGETIQTGSCSAVMGSALNSLRWIAEFRSRHGDIIEAGSIVMTGSIFATFYPGAPQTVRFGIHGLGSVSMDIE